MGQTAAVCGNCGYDFPPPRRRPWWKQQSTLRGWLAVMTVLTLPLAFFHYASQAPSRTAVALGFASCCLCCALLLPKSPLWTTIFEWLALGGLLVVCWLSL
jgi:hypothetical protein